MKKENLMDEIIKDLFGIGVNAKHTTPMTKGECKLAMKKYLLEYADQFKPEFPKVMEVRNLTSDKWRSSYVVYFDESDSTYLDSSGNLWKFAREIPTKVKVTKEQIAEKFGTTVEQLEIEE